MNKKITKQDRRIWELAKNVVFLTIIMYVASGCVSFHAKGKYGRIDEYIMNVSGDLGWSNESIKSFRKMCYHIADAFPVRVGMSADEVKGIVDDRTPERAKDQDVGFVFLDVPSEVTPKYMSYFVVVDNMYECIWSFWVDMAMEEGRVKNIHVVPGNFETFLLPGFRLAGEGEQEGMLVNEIRTWETGPDEL